MFKFLENRNETSKKMIGEKELEKYMDSDYHCLSHLPMTSDAIDDRYCQCGKKRSAYPCELANFWYTNVSCSTRRELNSDDILKVDRNTVFLTKKNLMMNQFLEFTNSTPPPPPLKNLKTEVEDKLSWFDHSFPRNRFAICNIGEANSPCKSSVTCSVKSNNTNIASTLCTSSSLFLDKRIVSLLRGITLYWFICLNTVLAKSELLKKKNPIALVSDINCDTATALLDAISATDSTSVPPFSHALAELQVSLDILENACNLENDILWILFRDSFIKESQLQNHAVSVLPFDQHSKNNLLEQIVHKLVNGWIAMWRNLNQMPTPKRHCPYLIPTVFSRCRIERQANESSQNENHEEKRNVHYEPHVPANENYPYRSSSPSPSHHVAPPLLYPVADHNVRFLVDDFATIPNYEPFWINNKYRLPTRIEISNFSQSLGTFFGDAAPIPLNLTFGQQSAFADRHRGLIFAGNTGEMPPYVQLNLQSASLDRHESPDSFSPSTPARPFAEAMTPALVVDDTDIKQNRFFVPMLQNANEVSHGAYWKLIAEKFGDPETNAASVNDAANLANADYNPADALVSASPIKVEFSESPIHIDRPPKIDEAAMLFENQDVDVVGDWPNHVAAINGEVSGCLNCDPCSVENSEEVSADSLDRDNEGRDDSGSYSPPASSTVHERALLTCALHDGIQLVDGQYLDVDENLQHDHFGPRDCGNNFIYAPNRQNSIFEDEEESPTVASFPSSQIDPWYMHVTELQSQPAPEIDVADLPSLSSPVVGTDWSCYSSQSIPASTRSDVNFNACHRFENELANVIDLNAKSAKGTSAQDSYERLKSDHVHPTNYPSSTSPLAGQIQYLTSDSTTDWPAILTLNSKPVFDACASPIRSDGQVISTNSSELHSSLVSSTVNADQAAINSEASASELSIQSLNHGGPASSSNSNNSSATKEGDALSNESDDSELIALTNPSEVHQLTPNEHRYFLPQGILGGTQQECAEFNMWRWPWVNSVQLLRQESHQPQLNDESHFPLYQMWTMPLVNVVIRQQSRSADTPLQLPGSATSLLLLTPSLKSDAGLNASSEYSLWSSPKLVDVEQLSSVERQPAENSDTTTNPMPSHENACEAGVQFPPFVPIIRGLVTFSDRGAFQYYRRQPLIDDGIPQDSRVRYPSSVTQFHFAHLEPISGSVDEEQEADNELRYLMDDDEQLSAPLDSPYVFRPVAPAFKVLTDAQPPMLRSASGLEYQQNGRKLLVFEHELDSKSDDPYLFQPKYVVSINDKACQTEPELFYTSAVSVPCSPYPVRGEPSNASQMTRSRHSPNLAATPCWPPPRHQSARQVALQHPQHLWPSYQAAVSAAAASAAAASTSQPWSNAQFPSPTQPTPPWTAAQPAPQTWAASPLQYYSLNDMFSHLGQPGFANVGEYNLPVAMTFSST